jgi:hypothetical protein
MFYGVQVNAVEVEEFLQTHSAELDSIFEDYISSRVEEVVESFKNYNLVGEFSKKLGYRNIGLPIDKVDLDKLLKVCPFRRKVIISPYSRGMRNGKRNPKCIVNTDTYRHVYVN